MSQAYRQLVNRDLPLDERGCASKAAFSSRREARSVSHGRRSDGALKPYHCGRCDLWHLGHKKRRVA